MRDANVDIAKGLGILLVVWGHSSLFLFDEIYAFHMPLFFFIAGFFFATKDTLVKFIGKKIKTLIVPYMIFYLLTVIYYFLILNLTGRGEHIGWNVFYDLAPIDNEIMNTPLWFLYALFWMSIIYYLLRRYVKNDIGILIISIVLFVANEVLRHYEISLPMYMNRSIGELIYMHLGYCFYRRYPLHKCAEDKLANKIGVTVSFAGAFIGLYLMNTYINQNWVNFLLKVIIALFGLMMVIGLSTIIKSRWGILKYLGEHSLVIFSIHMPMFEIARPIAKRIFATDSIGYDILVFGGSLICAVIVGEILMLAFHRFIGEGVLYKRIKLKKNI